MQGTVLGTVGYMEESQRPAPEELTIWVGDKGTDKDSWATYRRSETTRHSNSFPGRPGAGPPERDPPWLEAHSSQRTDVCGRLHRPPGTLGTQGRGTWASGGEEEAGRLLQEGAAV